MRGASVENPTTGEAITPVASTGTRGPISVAVSSPRFGTTTIALDAE